MTPYLTGVPDFSAGGAIWQCWTVPFGELPGATLLEWRSTDGRLTAGREGHCYWSACDGNRVCENSHSLKKAMLEACSFAARRVAA